MGLFTGTAGNDSSLLAPSGFPFEMLDGLGGDDYLYSDLTFSAYIFPVTFYGGDGNDSLFLRNNASAYGLFYGGAGNDWISGGNNENDETMYGGDGNDVIIATFDGVVDGRDFMYGGSGSDRVSGGAGADTIYGDDGNDGFGVLITAGAAVFSAATTEGAGLFGGDGGDLVYGGAGNDYLYGGEGVDYLYGGTGIDLMVGGTGSDLIFSDVNGTVNGGGMFGEAGDDYLYGGSGQDNMVGGADNDQLYGAGANDYLYGQAGNDTMYGGDGVDVMVGDSGTFDIYNGGNGIDYMFCGTGNDSIAFENALGTTTNQNIEAIYGFTPAGGIDAIILFGFGAAVDTFQEVRDRAQYYAGINTTIITFENIGGITSKAIWIVGVHVDQLTAGDFGFVA